MQVLIRKVKEELMRVLRKKEGDENVRGIDIVDGLGMTAFSMFNAFYFASVDNVIMAKMSVGVCTVSVISTLMFLMFYLLDKYEL